MPTYEVVTRAKTELRIVRHITVAEKMCDEDVVELASVESEEKIESLTSEYDETLEVVRLVSEQ